MINVGITGQEGFIGSYLYNTLGLNPDKYNRITFDKIFFEDEEKLQEFVSKCDVIVHLAAMNRHKDPQVIYETNVSLVKNLIKALEATNSKPHIIFSSSTQEELQNIYGNSKKEGREIFINWAQKNGGSFSGLIIPNVFGPFGQPFYNSVVATFCHLLCNDKQPEIHTDSEMKLIYVGELVDHIIKLIDNGRLKTIIEEEVRVPHTKECTVSGLLSILVKFKELYMNKGIIPELSSTFELNLFNTFRCFMPKEGYFPRKFQKHTDPRGSFVEVIRLHVGGQVSFSTTVPGITRGNHFHTRKIERFAVIKGKALIQLRRIGTTEVFNFYLDGEEPSYVDMPIWYTHNIKNIGEEELYTNFWINEHYNPEDADTYLEEV